MRPHLKSGAPMISSLEEAAKRIARDYFELALRPRPRSLQETVSRVGAASAVAVFRSGRSKPLVIAPPTVEELMREAADVATQAAEDAARKEREAGEWWRVRPCPADPYYDQWCRVRPGTGSAAIVSHILELTSDVRARPREEGKRLRKRKPDDQLTYETIVQALVAALVRRHLVKPGAWTRITLGHPRYCTAVRPREPKSSLHKKPGAQLRPCYYSRAIAPTIRKVLDALASAGTIDLRVGRAEMKDREPSHFRAAEKFAALIREHGASLNDFCRDPEETTLVLKDRRPEGRDGRGRLMPALLIDYTGMREVEGLVDEMQAINRWLAEADVAYRSNDGSVDHINNRSLRRIFNNASFQQGGRLFGGFWQFTTMRLQDGDVLVSKPYRGHVRIEGEPVVVVDYGSMLLRLLYVEAGVQPPAGDLYLGIDGLSSEHRSGVKQVISAMLFRTTPLTRLPRGTAALFPKGWGATRIEKAIFKRHAAVAKLFYSALDCRETPIGHMLFWRESEVLLAVLRACREQGVVALPVHDAIIVKESKAEHARRIMLDAFKAVTGFEGQAGEPKRPGDESAVIDTVLDDSGELPENEKFEMMCKALQRDGFLKTEDGRSSLRSDAQQYLLDAVPLPDGTDDSDLW